MTEATETAVAEIVERLREDNDWLMRSRLVGHELRALQAGNNALRAAAALEAEHAARVKAEGALADAGPKKITVDIGEAMKALQASPELGQAMNEAVFGKVATEALAAAERDNAQLRETLRAVLDRAARFRVFAPEFAAARALLKENPHD